MNKNKWIGLIVAIVIIIVILLIVFIRPTNNYSYQNITNIEASSSTTSLNTTSTTSPTNTTPALNTYTLSEVASHGDINSCWSIIDNSVYDLTNWIAKHPGGEQNILNICGKDGTAAFDQEHGGKQKILKILATFKIGNLSSTN